MPFPENPSEMTPESARDFLREYDEAYDVLDAQGQFSPNQIRAQLGKKFFGASEHPDTSLVKIRNIALDAKAAEASLVTEKVADATARIVEPRQTVLFEATPSETTEVLRPKTEMQANYEDFEAAYALQTADGAKPDEIVFKTVVNGTERQIAMPYVVAKTVAMPPSKSVRVLVLHQHIRREECVE